MTDLRMKRLLTLATTINGDHKRFYSQYCVLSRMGYTGWVLGTAFLTDEGVKKLKELNNVS